LSIKEMDMTPRDLIAVSAKPIILSLLTEGETYGYQILLRVRLVSGGALKWSSEMLHPVLHGLEKDGLIRSAWKASEEGRLRRCYFLTDKGRWECAAEKERWLNVHDALNRFWDRAEAFAYSTMSF
jgi:PadR family transcriptional regulator PadR